MFLRYGTYTHGFGEVWVRLDRTTIEDNNKVGIGNTFRWDISGRLKGVDQNDLTAKITALELAYGQNGQDLVLLQNDGVTPSAHQMLNADTAEGVRVLGIRYPQGNNAQYSTYRDYEITIVGDIYGDLTVPLTLTYSENIQQFGDGGPRFVLIPTLNTQPIRQVVSDFTPIRIVQSGQATSNLDFPEPPPPIYPLDEHRDGRVVNKSQQDLNYTTSWQYTFERSVAPGPHF